jgi:hypothetical protein
MERHIDKPIKARVESGHNMEASRRAALRLLRLLERLEARERAEAKSNADASKE